MRLSFRELLPRVASLLLLGSGAAVLMADSTDCPDGYAAATYDANFVSSCPTSFVPARGTLHLSLAGGQTLDNDGLARDLGAAGFHLDTARVDSTPSTNACVYDNFDVTGGADGDKVHCTGVKIGVAQQTVTCTGTVRSPLVLDLGRGKRDAGDALDAASAPVDAGDVGDAGDAGELADGASPADGGEGDGASGSQGPGGSGPAWSEPVPAYLRTPTSCTITFEQVAP